jgi:hypothetical protein
MQECSVASQDENIDDVVAHGEDSACTGKGDGRLEDKSDVLYLTASLEMAGRI